MSKHVEILQYIAKKSWSSLTGLVGECERKFGSRFDVVEFNGWCVVANVDSAVVALTLDSGEVKGCQVNAYVYEGKKKLADPMAVFVSERG